MFDALLKELDGLNSLKKSMSDNKDEKLKTGATDADDDSLDNNDELLGKSVTVTDDDGNSFDAVDGTELIKSLVGRLEIQEEAFSNHTDGLMKSLNAMVDTLKGQGDMIKSLSGQIDALRNQGRGRQSVVTIAEKPEKGTLAKSESDGVSSEEFLAKCMTAMENGRINGLDVSVAEASINRGMPVPDHIVRKVLS